MPSKPRLTHASRSPRRITRQIERFEETLPESHNHARSGTCAVTAGRDIVLSPLRGLFFSSSARHVWGWAASRMSSLPNAKVITGSTGAHRVCHCRCHNQEQDQADTEDAGGRRHRHRLASDSPAGGSFATYIGVGNASGVSCGTDDALPCRLRVQMVRTP